MMPFGNTRSPLKLTREDPKGRSRFRSNFICWYAIMYITSTELPLPTKTILVLYPSIISMITSGSSCDLERKWCLYLLSFNALLLDALHEHYWLVSEVPSQGSIQSTCDWPSSDHPYFTYDLLRTFPLIFFVVVIRLFFHPGVGLIVFLDKLLKFPSLN